MKRIWKKNKIFNFSQGVSLALSWAKKGGFAIVDQVLFSGATFIINILLARWLPPEEYGAFAVALSIYYLFLNFHSAVLTEPMMVFGAGKYRERFREYLGIVMWGHWGVSALLVLGLIVTSWVFFQNKFILLSHALVGLAIAFPFLMLLWLSRRVSYVIFKPWQAVIGSGIYGFIIIVFLWLLLQNKRLSVFSSILTLGIGGLLASIPILYLAKPRWWGFTKNFLLGKVIKNHLNYGRWAVGTVFLMWIPANIAYTLLPIWSGLEASAVVRALMNLTLPIQHIIVAIGTLSLPALAYALRVGQNKFMNLLKILLVVFIGSSLAYGILLLILKKRVVSLLYGDRYAYIEQLVPFITLLVVSVSLTTVIGGALRAMEKPQLIFKSYIFTMLMTITVGVVLIKNLKVIGAVISVLLSSLTTTTVMGIYFYKILHTYDLFT